MATATWKFILANSTDMSHIGELNNARSKSLSLVLNRPGSCSFTIAMDDDLSNSIQPILSAIKCYRNNILIWSGYVSNINEDISGNSMSVDCVGWLQRLEKRFLRRDKNYPYVAGVSTDDGDIVRDLLDEANLTSAPDGYSIPIPAGSDPNTPTWMELGSKFPNEGAGGPTAYTNAYRGVNYLKYQGILSAITDLTETENGCDIYVDPETRELNIYRKKMSVRPDTVFGYNWGPNNIAQLGRQIDSSVVCNYIVVNGINGITPGLGEELSSQSVYGIFEENVSLPDINSLTVLQTYGAGEVLIRNVPRVTYSMTPFTYTEGGRVPEPFVDYDVGDKVYFTAKWGARININNQAVRVFGISLSISEEGNESVGNLQVSP